MTDFEKTMEDYQSWLRHRLHSSERYEHSVGAYEKAVELCDKFRLPQAEKEQAAIAALLHDCAKLMGPEALLTACDEYGIEIDPIDQATPQTLHPFVGAEIVRREFGIANEEILNAIRYHTTGRPAMSRVEQIVYIADKIEGNTRNPLYVQKMTAHLHPGDPDSLAVTVRYILDSTIQFLIEKGQLIHPRTLEARNYFVEYLKNHATP